MHRQRLGDRVLGVAERLRHRRQVLAGVDLHAGVVLQRSERPALGRRQVPFDLLHGRDERRRVALARALVADADLLILDEPTTGLDVMSTRAMRGFLHKLRDEGRCVLFSSHIMQEVGALCDRIVVIAHGKVVADAAPDALREQAATDNLEDAFVKVIGSAEGLAA